MCEVFAFFVTAFVLLMIGFVGVGLIPSFPYVLTFLIALIGFLGIDYLEHSKDSIVYRFYKRITEEWKE